MQKRDFETYQKRFRDFEILPKFSETHVFRGTIRHPYDGDDDDDDDDGNKNDSGGQLAYETECYSLNNNIYTTTLFSH